MKIVFNFNLSRALLATALLAAAAPSVARGEGIYFSTRDLLSDFFRTSQNVTYRKVAVGSAERARLLRRLGYAPVKGSYTFFVASSSERVDGYAFIDEELGEHLPITFAVKLSPEGVVLR